SVTQYVAMLAAFMVVMHRYTGQQDIAIGTVVTNRNRSELERLIGFFVNTLVIRADVLGNVSFKEFLGHIKNAVTEAVANQDLPFEMLVREIDPARDLSRAPLFQVMFAFDAAPTARMSLAGLTMSSFEFDTGSVAFDLIVQVSTASTELSAVLTYNRD